VLEIGYVHEGHGTFMIGAKHLPFRAGDTCLINPAEPHIAYYPVTCVCSWIYVDPARLLSHAASDAMLIDTTAFGGPSFVNIFASKDYPWIDVLVRQVIDELADRKPYFEDAVRGLFLALMSGLHRLRRAGDPHFSRESRAPTSFGSLARIGPALAYVQEHFARPIGIGTLARTVSMSPTYLIDHRLLSAIKMLHDESLSVEQIAERCGFRDASGLRKAFKARLGSSPAKWRR
jgi:AraC-like DNA-binding protein